MSIAKSDTVGVLASGGLDSSILIGHLLRQRRRVQAFYIRTGLLWQTEELPALGRFLAAVATNDLAPLVVLDLPLTDLYHGHWSLTGNDTPGADSADEAVFLPGRNALLIVKAAVWCQLHGISELAMAPFLSAAMRQVTPLAFSGTKAARKYCSSMPAKAPTLPPR